MTKKPSIVSIGITNLFVSTNPIHKNKCHPGVRPRRTNRWQQTVTAGAGIQSEASYSTTTNRMDGTCYDAAGDVLDDGPCPIAGINHQYAYDSEGKLVSSNGGTIGYIYDAEDNRIAKTSSGAVTNVYFYDTSGHMRLETNGAIGVLRAEVYAGDRHLLTLQGSGSYYSHASWLGTVGARSDVNGNICEITSSSPFGDAQQSTGTCSPSNLFFTGKERDAESGLDYFGARYYGSSMGRFMSPDPKTPNASHLMNPQKWNKYAYTLNNPLSMIDPDGQDPIFVFIPRGTSNTSGWKRAERTALKNGNTLTVYSGKTATVENYNKALATPDSHFVMTGHGVEDGQKTTGSVHLANGDVGVYAAAPDKGQETIPNTPVGDVQASTVGVFTCNGADLAGQYSSTDFTGMASGKGGETDLGTLESSALAYTNVIAKDGSVAAATNAANSVVKTSDKAMNHDGDKVKSTPPQ